MIYQRDLVNVCTFGGTPCGSLGELLKKGMYIDVSCFLRHFLLFMSDAMLLIIDPNILWFSSTMYKLCVDIL